MTLSPPLPASNVTHPVRAETMTPPPPRFVTSYFLRFTSVSVFGDDLKRHKFQTHSSPSVLELTSTLTKVLIKYCINNTY